MKIDVYDSYTKTPHAQMHFDVFVASGTSADLVFKYGQSWLESVGEKAADLDQSRCNFCHSEIANPEVQRAVENNGYFILQMEGCPSPFNK